MKLVFGLLLALVVGISHAADLTVDVAWTEPTYANDPTAPYSQLRFTRIRWSPVACLDQPPPGVRDADWGQWTHCGFGWPLGASWRVDVPANTPAGGEHRTVTLTIPDANLAWPELMFVFDFFVADGKQYFGLDEQETRVARVPIGELTKPPIALKVVVP